MDALINFNLLLKIVIWGMILGISKFSEPKIQPRDPQSFKVRCIALIMWSLLRDMGDPIRTIKSIWMFPEMGVLPNHPFIDGIFHELNNPAMGYLYFWKPPCLYNQHIDALSKKTQVHTMLIPDFLGWLFILVIVKELTPTKTSQKTSGKNFLDISRFIQRAF